MSSPSIVPVDRAIPHSLSDGDAVIVTAYELPLLKGVGNTNTPFSALFRISSPLFSSVMLSPGSRPEIKPPTLNSVEEHCTNTLLAFDPEMVPLPCATWQN